LSTEGVYSRDTGRGNSREGGGREGCESPRGNPKSRVLWGALAQGALEGLEQPCACAVLSLSLCTRVCARACTEGGTRRVQLVRKEGQDVSS